MKSIYRYPPRKASFPISFYTEKAGNEQVVPESMSAVSFSGKSGLNPLPDELFYISQLDSVKSNPPQFSLEGMMAGIPAIRAVSADWTIGVTPGGQEYCLIEAKKNSTYPFRDKIRGLGWYWNAGLRQWQTSKTGSVLKLMSERYGVAYQGTVGQFSIGFTDDAVKKIDSIGGTKPIGITFTEGKVTVSARGAQAIEFVTELWGSSPYITDSPDEIVFMREAIAFAEKHGFRDAIYISAKALQVINEAQPTIASDLSETGVPESVKAGDAVEVETPDTSPVTNVVVQSLPDTELPGNAAPKPFLLIKTGKTYEVVFDRNSSRLKDLYYAIIKPSGISYFKNKYTGQWSANPQTIFFDAVAKLLRTKGIEEYIDVSPEVMDEFKSREATLALSRMEDASHCEGLLCPPGLKYMPFQCGGIRWALKRKGTLIGDSPGLGKAQPVTSNILTPNGFVSIGTVAVGDLVAGSDGRFHRVTGVFPQGVKKAFRVVMNDGATTVCCDEHLWTVKSKSDRKLRKPCRTMQLSDIMASGVVDKYGHKWFVPLCEPVAFSEKPFPIDPYLLGALIANGAIAHNRSTFSGGRDQVSEIENLIPAGLSVVSVPSDRWTYRIASSGAGVPNPLIAALRDIGLLGKQSCEKSIPSLYMLGSVEQRVSLLQGLMDNDGTISKSGTIEYNTASKKLADDIMALIRSLGGVAWESTRKPKYRYKGESKVGKTDHRIRMMLPNWLVPFRLKRKSERVVPLTKYQPAHAISRIEEIEPCEMVCISVDASDRLYVTDDYILTHNTIQSLGVINNDPEIKTILVAAPRVALENWAREAKKWLIRPFNIYKAETTGPCPDDANFVIFNYAKVVPLRGKSAFLDSLMAREWDLLIVDEAHFLKEPDSKRTISILGQDPYKDKPQVEGLWHRAKKFIALTGTPIPNRPIEIFPIVHRLDPVNYGNFFGFAKRYASAHQTRWGWNFDGASNLDELQEKLRTTVMIRRLKNEVLKELPPKVRQVLVVPKEDLDDPDVLQDIGLSSASPWTVSAYDDDVIPSEEDLEESLQEIAEEIARGKKTNADLVDALQDFGFHSIGSGAALRIRAAMAKMSFLIEAVEQALETNKKIVIMAHHKEVEYEIERRINEKFGPGTARVYNSETSGGVNGQKIIDDFQGTPTHAPDPKYRVFVGAIMSCQVAITLTAATTMIFAEMDWVPGNVMQAEDRIYRIGTTDSVLIQYVVIDRTMDAYIAKMLERKGTVIDAALDKAHSRDAKAEIPMLRMADTKYEKWAQTCLEKISDKEISQMGESNRIFVGEVRQQLASGAGLSERQWTRACALARQITRVAPADISDDKPVRNANNPLERWASGAILSLAGMDSDRARVANQMGFNKPDSYRGNTIASLLYGQDGMLCEEDWRSALSIAFHYHKTQTPMDAEAFNYWNESRKARGLPAEESKPKRGRKPKAQ